MTRCPKLLSYSEISTRAGMWGHWKHELAVIRKLCLQLTRGRETSTVHTEYCSWDSMRHQVCRGAWWEAEHLKGPKTYKGPLALKKLYNKRKGVTSPPELHSQLFKVWTFPFVWMLYNTARGADFVSVIHRDAKLVLQNGQHRGESGPSESKGSNTREVKRCSIPLHLPSSSSSLACLRGLDELQRQIVAEPILFL